LFFHTLTAQQHQKISIRDRPIEIFNPDEFTPSLAEVSQLDLCHNIASQLHAYVVTFLVEKSMFGKRILMRLSD
jgi:hypothetical protein